MSLVMLVEDEAVLRHSMARSLRRLPGVDVVEAGRIDEARRLLHERTPSLIISDLSLPDGCGIDLLSEMDEAQLNVPVMFVTAYLGTYSARIPERSNIEVFEKPLALSTLRAKVRGHIEKGPQEASPFSLIDYLQLSGMGRHSVVLRLVRNHRQFGRITVLEGRPWSARAGGLTGADAVRRLVFSEGYTIQAQPLSGDPGPSNIDASMDHVLLEACREQDEATRPPEAPLPMLMEAPAVDEPTADDIDAAIDVLETGDWDLSAATRPGAPMAPVVLSPDSEPPVLVQAPVPAPPVSTQQYGDPAESGELPPWDAAPVGPVGDPGDASSLNAPGTEPARSMRDWVDELSAPAAPAQAPTRSMRDWEETSSALATAERPQWAQRSWRRGDETSAAPASRSMRDWVDPAVSEAPRAVAAERSMRDWIDDPLLDARGSAAVVAQSAPPAPAAETRSMRDWVDARPSRSGSTPSPKHSRMARQAAPAPEPELSASQQRFEALLDEGLDALLARTYDVAWRVFSEADAVQPGHPVVQANLARIEALGHKPE
jgi:CheY-like chemotaxis protein